MPIVERVGEFHDLVLENDAGCGAGYCALVEGVDVHENTVELDHLHE